VLNYICFIENYLNPPRILEGKNHHPYNIFFRNSSAATLNYRVFQRRLYPPASKIKSGG